MSKETLKSEKISGKIVFDFIKKYNDEVHHYNRNFDVNGKPKYSSMPTSEKLQYIEWNETVEKLNQMDEATKIKLDKIQKECWRKFYQEMESTLYNELDQILGTHYQDLTK